MSGEGARGCSAVKQAVAAMAGTISCFRDDNLRRLTRWPTVTRGQLHERMIKDDHLSRAHTGTTQAWGLPAAACPTAAWRRGSRSP